MGNGVWDETDACKSEELYVNDGNNEKERAEKKNHVGNNNE